MKQNISKLKAKSIKYKTLIENFSYLSALQIFNMILPLMTYPYLIRVLGKDVYGTVAYAQAIIGYLGILISFGFDLSAIKEISINRNNPKKLSEITNSVVILKGFLFIISSVILVVLVELIPEAKDYKLLFYVTMFMTLNTVIYPNWYFQGIEQMKYITYINLISRLIAVPLIFIIIRSSTDFIYLPIANGIGAIVGGIISLYIIYYKHKLKFYIPSILSMIIYFKESVPIFISSLSIKIYVSSNKVIIGSFLSMTEVAYYDLAEKIVGLLRTPQGIFSQTIYPKINNEKNIGFVKKIFWLSLLFNLALFIGTVIFAKYIVTILGGDQMLQSIWVVSILAFTVPIVAMSNILGLQILIPWGYSKVFSKVIILSGIVYLIQLSIVWTFFNLNIYTISAITVTTEVFVTSYMFFMTKKYGLW